MKTTTLSLPEYLIEEAQTAAGRDGIALEDLLTLFLYDVMTHQADVPAYAERLEALRDALAGKPGSPDVLKLMEADDLTLLARALKLSSPAGLSGIEKRQYDDLKKRLGLGGEDV